MNFTGLLFGLFTLCLIGFGFVWVIKLEYYLGPKTAWPVGLLGAGIILLTLFLSNFTFSALVGILGGTIVWGALELPDQEKRVQRGLFPANPRRTKQENSGKKEERGQ